MVLRTGFLTRIQKEGTGEVARARVRVRGHLVSHGNDLSHSGRDAQSMS